MQFDMQSTLLSLLALVSSITAIKVPSKAPCPSSKCSTKTNHCGKSWGGCWDQCAGPMTSFFPSPKCNVAVETPACSPATVCVDAINTCGMRYGGCYNTCDGPFTQQVTAPACPTTALARTTHSHHANTSTHSSKKLANTSTVTASYSVITPAAKLEDHGVRDNSMAITMASSCTPHTLCVDAINSCGSRYGGCYNTCEGEFSHLFTAPPCPAAPTKAV